MKLRQAQPHVQSWDELIADATTRGLIQQSREGATLTDAGKAFVEAALPSNRTLSSMTESNLKLLMKDRGVSIEGCKGRADMIRRLRPSDDEKMRQQVKRPREEDQVSSRPSAKEEYDIAMPFPSWDLPRGWELRRGKDGWVYLDHALRQAHHEPPWELWSRAGAICGVTNVSSPRAKKRGVTFVEGATYHE